MCAMQHKYYIAVSKILYKYTFYSSTIFFIVLDKHDDMSKYVIFSY